jgi:membrane fusion protein, heavy metal efflux system
MNTNNQDPLRKPRRQRLIVAAVLALGAVAAVAIWRMEPPKPADEHGHAEAHGHEDEHGHADEHGHQDEHGHGDAHAESAAKGPHGGQLLNEEAFTAEVLITEAGGAPRMKLWLQDKGKPLAPTAAKVTATITRPDGQQQEITFAPDKDALQSAQPIEEPHVFEAMIEIQTPGEPYLFDYRMEEGRISLSDAQIKAAGVQLDTARPAQLQSSLQLPGEIRFNEDRTVHLQARVSGSVEAVPVTLGQRVKRGQPLAVIASAEVSDQRSELQTAQRRLQLAKTTHEREKRLWEEKISPQQDVLQAEQAMREAEIAVRNAQQKLQVLGATTEGTNRFELRAPLDGTIVDKRVAVGQSVQADSALFTLSDLSTVWASVSVPARELGQVRTGEEVLVRSSSGETPVRGKVIHISALVGEQTRAAEVRVALQNPQLVWRPGLPVTVEPVQAGPQVPVTVPSGAVQTLEGKPSVFVKVAGGFLPIPVKTGRSDGQRVEIVQGLKAGATVAADGSFVLKSEHGKASAGHGH